jgi:hypothetical protein
VAGEHDLRGRKKILPTQRSYYSTFIYFVNIYFKYFVCCGIALLRLKVES